MYTIWLISECKNKQYRPFWPISPWGVNFVTKKVRFWLFGHNSYHFGCEFDAIRNGWMCYDEHWNYHISFSLYFWLWGSIGIWRHFGINWFFGLYFNSKSKYRPITILLRVRCSHLLRNFRGTQPAGDPRISPSCAQQRHNILFWLFFYYISHGIFCVLWAKSKIAYESTRIGDGWPILLDDLRVSKPCSDKSEIDSSHLIFKSNPCPYIVRPANK